MTIRIRRVRPIRAVTVVSLIAGGLIAGPLTGVAHAASTFVVNTAGNAGDTFIDGNCDTSATAGLQCTLRGAIQEANGSAGADTIQFALPSPYKVTLTATGLPAITGPVVIDGTTLPGFNPTGGTIVRVDGVSNTTGVEYGFDVQPGGAGTTIKGLEIDRFGSAGVRLASDNNVVSGNYIGTTAVDTVNCASGTSCSANVGVLVQDGSNNTIGGTTPADRNVLSNNASYGVQVTTTTGSSSNNVVSGNYIGTNGAGTAALHNFSGVLVDNEGGSDPTGTRIGGTAPGAGNLISGNFYGVDLESGSSTTIAGNIIGLNASGAGKVANTNVGVYAAGDMTSVTIGGSSAASRNVVSGNGTGVQIAGPVAPSSVQGNYIGTDSTGLLARGNTSTGIWVSSADFATIDQNVVAGNAVYQAEVDYGNGDKVSNNLIGLAANGTTALSGSASHGLVSSQSTDLTVDGNVASGNGCDGIYLNSTDGAVLTDNLVGVNQSGTAAVANQCSGIEMGSSSDATIGAPGHGNVVSGNAEYGLSLTSDRDSTVAANLVGTDAAGTSAIANAASGIWLASSERILVGGTDPGAGNVIAKNAAGCCEGGVYLSSADDNTFLGNRIGVGADGSSMPNGYYGVYVDGNSDGNQFGDGSAAGGNVIAHNGHGGITIAGNGLDNDIHGNSISNNTGLGIDLNEDGVSPNDPGDADSGANRLQNYPILTTSASNANGTQISGTLNSRANRQFRLDFYANTSCDASGNGEGETFLGSSTVTTNGAGHVSFQASVSGPAAAASQITATATDVAHDDTSEFSGCLANQGGLPSASVSNTSAAENAGTMTFTVTLSSAPVFTPVTVDYATSDGTATSPADYTATSGTVTFNAGETSKQINVAIVDDAVDENDETFTLTLSNPSNAVLLPGGATATATINDDDAPPSLSITSAPTVTEPDTGNVPQTFTVTLSSVSSLPVTVIIDTVTGTATEGVDFVAGAAQLTFNPGDTVKTFQVAVLGDVLDEVNEIYSAQLQSPTNATIGTGTRNATITDNDPPPNLSISDVTMLEGNSATKQFAFTLTLSTPSAKQVRATVSTLHGTATAPTDYVARNNVGVIIKKGATTATFNVTVNGDLTVEPDETFFVNIDSGQTTNANVVDSQGIGTIQNDD